MKRLMMILSLINFTYLSSQEGKFMTVGQRYVECIKKLTELTLLPLAMKELCEEDVQQSVNSKLICKSRDEIIKQIYDVSEADGGFTHIKILEVMECPANAKSVVHWSVTYGNGLKETVATFLTYNDQEKVTKIDIVYGESGSHQWQPKA